MLVLLIHASHNLCCAIICCVLTPPPHSTAYIIIRGLDDHQLVSETRSPIIVLINWLKFYNNNWFIVM